MHLDLTMTDDSTTVASVNATKDMLKLLLHSCKRLTNLIIRPSDLHRFPTFSVQSLLPERCFPSTVCHLDICVSTFDDCLCLLDGRLDRLCTFTVWIGNMTSIPTRRDNTVCCWFLKETVLPFEQQFKR
jgi:hypothetical protein